MAQLYMEYLKTEISGMVTFQEYLRSIGYVDPSATLDGMDDGLILMAVGGPELFHVPEQPITGDLEIIVLLVDFEDRPGVRPPDQFRDLLLSDGIYPTGSLVDYYREVTCGAVRIKGAVYGWFRLPHLYSFYTNGKSGTDVGSYPRNAEAMAEDAVKAALAAGVPFAAAEVGWDHGAKKALGQDR